MTYRYLISSDKLMGNFNSLTLLINFSKWREWRLRKTVAVFQRRWHWGLDNVTKNERATFVLTNRDQMAELAGSILQNKQQRRIIDELSSKKKKNKWPAVGSNLGLAEAKTSQAKTRWDETRGLKSVWKSQPLNYVNLWAKDERKWGG